jgi:hypothetical protein
MVRVMFGTSNNLCFVGRQKCTSMELVGGFRDRSMRGTASSDRCVLVHELLEQRHWYSMTRLLSMVAYRNCSDAIVNGSEICGAYTHTRVRALFSSTWLCITVIQSRSWLECHSGIDPSTANSPTFFHQIRISLASPSRCTFGGRRSVTALHQPLHHSTREHVVRTVPHCLVTRDNTSVFLLKQIQVLLGMS